MQEYSLDLQHKDMIQRIANNMQSDVPCYFHQYKIVRELGSGAFGKVYQCQSDGVDYAIKIYSYQSIRYKYNEASAHKIIGYIEQQGKLMHQCRSKYIVKCFGVQQSQLYTVLVLEFCGKQNLRMFLDRKGGCLQEGQAIAIIKQVCMGVIAMHEKNIIHRDLKLQNIMIADGVCKIIDLGLSKKLSTPSTVLCTNLGTEYTKAPQVKELQENIHYTSAPQLQKTRGYGLKADIYSIGIIYLKLVSDLANYDQRNAYNFYNSRAKLFKRATSTDSIDFIGKAIEVNQFLRISWKELLMHPLFRGRGLSVLDSSIDQQFESVLHTASRLIIESSGISQESPHQSFILETNDPPREPQNNLSEQRQQIRQRSLVQVQNPSGKLIQAEVKPQNSSNRSVILMQQDFPQVVEGEQKQLLQYIKSLNNLQQKKAQFIYCGIIQRIQNQNLKIHPNDKEMYIILMYLLSLHALNLINQPYQYYANNDPQSIANCQKLRNAILERYETYKLYLVKLLKNVNSAFIENAILRNYQTLNPIINLKQMDQLVDLNEEHLNLIMCYLHQLVVRILSRQIKSTLLSFKQVMKIMPCDLNNTDFEGKFKQIRKSFLF